MSRDFDGVDDKVLTTFTAHSTLRTYAIWSFRQGAGGGSGGRFFDKGASDSEIWQNDNAAVTYRYQRNHSTTNGAWTMPQPSLNVWHHLVLAYDSGSTANDPVMYLDGVSQTVTETTTPAGTVTDNASAYEIGNRTNSLRAWDGFLAEFAIWGALLNASEANALAKGVSPLRIRPASLVYYAPMWGAHSPEPNYVGGGTATVTGALAAQHPPVMMPSAGVSGWLGGFTAAAPAAGWGHLLSSTRDRLVYVPR